MLKYLRCLKKNLLENLSVVLNKRCNKLPFSTFNIEHTTQS